MSKRARVKIWALLENIPAVLTVAFSAYVLVQSQTSDLEEMEVLNWLLGQRRSLAARILWSK